VVGIADPSSVCGESVSILVLVADAVRGVDAIDGGPDTSDASSAIATSQPRHVHE
jgi:hypothetical protein